MTDAETIADLRAELSRLKADRDRWKDLWARSAVNYHEQLAREKEMKDLWVRSAVNYHEQLAREKEMRDALAAKAEEMGKCIAELAVATACEECGESFSLARIIASETLCEGCQSEADEELPPC